MFFWMLALAGDTKVLLPYLRKKVYVWFRKSDCLREIRLVFPQVVVIRLPVSITIRSRDITLII